MTRIGRPPMLLTSPWHRRRYLRAVSMFASQRVAAPFARVDRRTRQRTVARGRRDRREREERGDEHEEPSPYEALLNEVERAEAEAEVRLLAQIQLAGEQNWTACAWLLERRVAKRPITACGAQRSASGASRA